jgi:hypothetical protein
LADLGEQPLNQAPVAAGEHVFGGELDVGRRLEEILPQGPDRFLTLEPRSVGRRMGVSTTQSPVMAAITPSTSPWLKDSL